MQLSTRASSRGFTLVEIMIVVVIIGPQFEQERAPVICLDIRQHVERCDPRSEKLERRPVLVLLEFLLERLGIAENL